MPDPVPHMTPDEFRALGHRMVDWIADYWRRVHELPVRSRVRPGEIAAKLPVHAPEAGFGRFSDSWDAIFRDLDDIVVPGLTHWQHPNFHAFFPANISGPSVLGEMLSAGLGIQGMLWATSPACTEIETRVLDWLGEAIGLPESFLSRGDTGGGVIQGTASEATLVALVAARSRARQAHRRRFTGDGTQTLPTNEPHLVAYASTQAHSSIIKAAMIAGLADGPGDRQHLRLIECDEHDRIKPAALEAAMREDLAAGRVPFFVVATMGTTSSTAVDSLREIGEVLGRIRDKTQDQPTHQPPPSERGSVWLHVDAAHSGAALVCPEMRWMSEGVERADSIAFNPHKWLLVNFDCNCFWTRDRAAILESMSITPEYLRNAASDAKAVVDYRDWHVPLGRRFRALKLWFVLRHYGLEGLRAYIREHLRWSEVFESWVRGDERFEVLAPRTVNLICFRLRPRSGEAVADVNARNTRLLEALNASGRVYLTHTTLRRGGENLYTIRFMIGTTSTREEHVRAAWRAIGELADGV
jgi:aromatic-L-amino-acid decarboxylase